MAEFETAYYLTNKIEAGYANDPDDKGGETYRGWSRKAHPDWKGWDVIDEVKSKAKNIDEINHLLDNNEEIQRLLKIGYKTEYWDKIQGDSIPDQQIANEVYDNAVHMGVETSSRYLQRTLNMLNRNQKYYNDIKVDGLIGSRQTLPVLGLCIKLNGVQRIVNVINGFQFKHYIERMEEDRTQEKYIGWFDRVEVVWN